MGFDEGKGGHSVAQYVSAPHQGDPVIKDDGGRKPVEILGVGKPQSMSDEPALQPVDLILIDQTYSRIQLVRFYRHCVIHNFSLCMNQLICCVLIISVLLCMIPAGVRAPS